MARVGKTVGEITLSATELGPVERFPVVWCLLTVFQAFVGGKGRLRGLREVKGWGSSKGFHQTIECLFEHPLFTHDVNAILRMGSHLRTTLISQGHFIYYNCLVVHENRCHDLEDVQRLCQKGHDGMSLVGTQNDCALTSGGEGQMTRSVGNKGRTGWVPFRWYHLFATEGM